MPKQPKSTQPQPSPPPAEKKAIPKLLPVPKVAEALGVASTTVKRLIRTKQLPGLKIGNNWRVSEHDLWVYMRLAKKKGEQVAAKQLARELELQKEPKPDSAKQPDLPHTSAQ